MVNSMKRDILVRKAAIGDLPRITEILNQAIEWKRANAFTEKFDHRERQEWFDSHSGDKYVVLVALMDNEVSGYLHLSPYREGRQAFEQTAEVSYYVDFAHHRKGIASALIEAAFVHCLKADIRVLLAFLYDRNEGSVAFLRRYGFEQWGLLPRTARVDGEVYDHAIFGKHVKGK